MSEEWRDVPGYEGRYQVSDRGGVRSLDRVIFNGRGSYTRPGKDLKPYRLKGRPYLQVDLRDRRRSVHHLVLEAFVRSAMPGEECRHLDGDGGNNTLANLAWGTRSENTEDQVRMGIHVQARKVSCPQGHPYNEENTARRRSGSRVCLPCKRASWRKWNQKRIEQLRAEVAA